MCTTCDDAAIARIYIREILDFRKEFWKQDRPVIITGETELAL